MNDKSLTIIISDLHLGGGDADLGDDHVYQGHQLERFVSQIKDSQEGNNGEIELFINGDFLEFAQTGQDIYKGDPGVGWCSQNESLAKLELIISGHQGIFSALKSFQDRGNRVTLAAGNHDVDLYWLQVQDRMKEEIGPVCFETGKEIVSRYGGRLLIGHGHMYEPANKFQNWSSPFIHSDAFGIPRLEMCPGTKFMVKFVNLLEARYPFADNIKPETSLARILWNEDKAGFALAGMLFFKFVGTSPIAALGIKTENEKDILKWIKANLVNPLFLHEITKLYRTVCDPLSDENSVRDALDNDEKILNFFSTVFVKCRPDDWLGILNGLPKPNLSIEAKGHNLSIVRTGISNDKLILRTMAQKLLSAQEVEVVIFGHTHQPDEDHSDSGAYYNPGSWTRYVDVATMAALTLEDLRNEGDFPYQLNYVQVRNCGEGLPLESKMINFEKKDGQKYRT